MKATLKPVVQLSVPCQESFSSKRVRLLVLLSFVILFGSVSCARKTEAAVKPGTSDSMPVHVSGDNADQYMKTVGALLAGEKFAELDAMASEVRTQRTRFHGGGWVVHTFYSAISFPSPSGGDDTLNADWQRLEETLRKWMTQKPESVTPRIALAEVYSHEAWRARGDGYADLVKDDGWKTFGQKDQLSLDVLTDAAALKEKCPEWYSMMMTLSRDLQWPGAKRKTLLREAVAFEPLYYYIYQDYAFSIQPRWGGEVGDSEAFATNIADEVGGKQGNVIYFQLAITLNCTGCAEDEAAFGRMSWKRMQEGYAALEELYGTSPYFLNEFAHLAIRAADHDAALKAFLRIGDDWREDVWHHREYFESSKGWALAAPSEFLDHWQTANLNARNPVGHAYREKVDAELEKYIATDGKACGTDQKLAQGPFGVTLLVRKDGTLEQAVAWPPTDVSVCLMPKISAHQFSAPPSPAYWVVYNIGEVKPGPFYTEGSTVPDIKN